MKKNVFLIISYILLFYSCGQNDNYNNKIIGEWHGAKTEEQFATNNSPGFKVRLNYNYSYKTNNELLYKTDMSYVYYLPSGNLKMNFELYNTGKWQINNNELIENIDFENVKLKFINSTARNYSERNIVNTIRQQLTAYFSDKEALEEQIDPVNKIIELNDKKLVLENSEGKIYFDKIRDFNNDTAEIVSENENQYNTNFEQKIKDLIKAEDNRDFDEIKGFFADHIVRYWNSYDINHNQLKNQYFRAWKNTPNSSNNIKKIEQIDDYNYVLTTVFQYFDNKEQVNRVITSNIKYVFNDEGKIIKIYPYTANEYKASNNNIKLMKFKTKSLLSSYNFFDDANIERNKKHTLYYFPINRKSDLILSFTSPKEADCHACESIMSAFVFSKGDGWHVRNKYYNFASIGNWGNPIPKKDIKVYPVNDNFLLTLKDSYVQTGISNESLSCYLSNGNNIKLIGTIDIGYNNAGFVTEDNELITWEGKYFFKNEKDKVPDLVLKIKGIKKGKKINEEEIYVFNGKEYVKLN